MECQVIGCDNQAEVDDLVCRDCHRRFVGRQSWLTPTEESLGPEVVSTVWGDFEVGGEG